MAPFPSPTPTWHSNTYPSISPTRPELSTEGKTVVITGGGTGIGAETARSFAMAGASRIALLGRREQPLVATRAAITQEFPKVEVFVASTDVTKKSEVDSAFATFLGNHGKVDVMVSNAAVTGPTDPVRDVDGELFIGAIEKNLRGALFIAQAFLRYASDRAVAIETNSSAAHVDFGAGFASYSVAKLAVFRLWDSVACANPNLRVFHVQPGVVDTAMNRASGGVAAVGFEDHVSLPATFNVWLASSEARFLNNKFLWANWDVDELKAKAGEIEAGTQCNVGLVGWPFGEAGWKFQIAQNASGDSAFRKM